MRGPLGALALALAAAAALLAGTPCGGAESKVYTYTDENGVTHFTNVPNDPRFRPAPTSEPPRRFTGEERSRPFEEVITSAAERHGLDPHLLRAVIKCESDFNRMAVSRSGAQGLMQLMPETARLVEVSNPFDAGQNLEGGARYLKYLLDSFKDTRLALAAYNAGEGAVRRHGGIPPYKETKNYVSAVISQYDRYCQSGAEGDVITSEDIQSFVNSEGVRLFTNVPGKYRKGDDWKQVSDR